MPEASIIIPAYNQGSFLKETLKSVSAQSFEDFECIIVDDGSTDNTALVAKEYSDGSKIKYFYQDNKGLAGARNTGIKLARGSYIHFLDSDDLIYKNYIERMVNKLKEDKNIDVLSCAWDLIDENGNKISLKIGPVKSGNYFRDLILENLFPVHSVVLKSSIFKKTGLFNDRLMAMEDWDMWLRIASEGYKFDIIDMVGVSYRRHKNCMTLEIDRMLNNLDSLLKIFYDTHNKYKNYRQYTRLYQTFNIYRYSEEIGDINYQNDLLKDINNLLKITDYNHYYFKKFYEVIRNISNKNAMIRLCKNIYNRAPVKYKSFWRNKIVKIGVKKLFKL